ncbi:MAG TPA: tetratricopeptide repeat protein [Casimicrobiaceae bacterium]
MNTRPPARNEPCPCGSGRRFKHCHGSEAVAAPTFDAEALFREGNALRLAGRRDAAIECYERALAAAPANAGILNNLGLALLERGEPAAAEARFLGALASAGETFESLANLGLALFAQHRYGPARTSFERALAREDRGSASLWGNLATCQARAGDRHAAARSFARAIALDPASPALHCNLGAFEIECRQFDRAAHSLERALALQADLPWAASALVYCRQQVADWRGLPELIEAEIGAAKASRDSVGLSTIGPFGFMTICDDASLQRSVAETWARANQPAASAVATSARHRDPGRLALGFVTVEVMPEHPVPRLVIDLLERLDRSRFRVVLYTMENASRAALPARLVAAVETIVLSSDPDPDALATRIRADGIDVLFDLDGLTGRAVFDTFLRRPAPLQVSFLGYTGTLGSPAYDRIVTDRHCIPPGAAHSYVEQPLYLDPCYLPSDTKRVSAAEPVERSHYRLPADALVACAHANTCKILPGHFARWMRLLVREPRVVLWLRDSGPDANDRLRAEARAAGVDPSRLAFAPYEPVPRYLARFALADLFLDTAPFGAHTTVNDALWAGLPVLAIDGASFAGRASASQLVAAGMPELVARDADDYEAKAEALLADPGRLRALRATLHSRRATSPLFDMRRYADSFMDAVSAAWAEARP